MKPHTYLIHSYPAAAILPLAFPAFLSFVSGCGKKNDATASAPAASLSTSSIESLGAGGTTRRYTFDPQGQVHADLPGLKERIKGDATGTQGTIDVVSDDLAKSRGMVRVDLSTFATSTFGTDQDATQTKHARTWLEVTAGDQVNEAMRWGQFAIRSIDGLSATDLAKVAPTQDGADETRTVTMTLHGELLVHGHALPKDNVVRVAFRYPAGAAKNAIPRRLQIDSMQPMRVVLKEYDVRPRDPAGQILEWTTQLVAKVADAADVTVHLGATLQQ